MATVYETEKPIYGLMAEFETPEQLVAATRAAYWKGFRRMDAYSPYPVEGLSEALNTRFNWLLPLLVLGAGVSGAIFAFATQYFATVISYPINVGGRPFNSWPMYVPITFELAVLFAAGTALIGMIVLNGLPQPYHPVFNVPEFQRASIDGFFLAVEARDPLFDADETRRFLQEQGAVSISEIQP